MTKVEEKFHETGEVRSPRKGEWFMGDRCPEQARFDFTIQKFPILRYEIIREDTLEERRGER